MSCSWLGSDPEDDVKQGGLQSLGRPLEKWLVSQVENLGAPTRKGK